MPKKRLTPEDLRAALKILQEVYFPLQAGAGDRQAGAPAAAESFQSAAQFAQPFPAISMPAIAGGDGNAHLFCCAELHSKRLTAIAEVE